MARPATPKLNTEIIAEAALALVDKHGEFTLPQLATALQVSASSLYNHVQGKGEIIELMRGRAMSAIKLPEAIDGDWQRTVRAIATAYWQSYSQHPRLIALLTSHTVKDATTLRVYDALAQALSLAGFAPRQRLQAITIIDSFVLGSALDAGAPDEVWRADANSSAAFTDALAAGLGAPRRAEDTFHAGLDVILQGLGRQVRGITRASPASS